MGVLQNRRKKLRKALISKRKGYKARKTDEYELDDPGYGIDENNNVEEEPEARNLDEAGSDDEEDADVAANRGIDEEAEQDFVNESDRDSDDNNQVDELAGDND